MKPFTNFKSVVAPLNRVDVDTDQIIPAQFLKRVERTGFGQFMFFKWRFNEDGSPNPNFVLNEPAYQGASILVSGRNFGSGSSREHAPWALHDYGFRCIIAPSFADIFYNNCFKNGILPIVLSSEIVDTLFAYQGEIVINLEEQSVKTEDNIYNFEVDAERKRRLINGLDDIGLTLQYEDQIRSFEAEHFKKYPWL